MGSCETVVAEKVADAFATGLLQAPIPVGDHAEVLLVNVNADTRVARGVVLQDACGVIGGTIVANDQFQIATILSQD